MKTHGFNHEDANGSLNAFLGFDGTTGRVYRHSYLRILNGTNANTVKSQMVNRINGNALSEVDNLGKGDSSGGFALAADGKDFTIEYTSLYGTVLAAWGGPFYMSVGSINAFVCSIRALSNDIQIRFNDTTNGGRHDITTMVDTGDIYLDIHYITNA